MQPRISPDKAFDLFPQIASSLYGLADAINAAELDSRLQLLIEIRASQINSCAYCLNMHNQEARKQGEDQQRLDALPAWREVPWFSERERVALHWCERLTSVNQGHPSDTDYETLGAHFTEREILALTALILKINSWNRVVAALHFIPERV